jgi:hypothetical protein
MMNNTNHRWEKLWDRDLNSIDQEIEPCFIIVEQLLVSVVDYIEYG